MYSSFLNGFKQLNLNPFNSKPDYIEAIFPVPRNSRKKSNYRGFTVYRFDTLSGSFLSVFFSPVSELFASVSFLQRCTPSGRLTPAVAERGESQWYKNTASHHQDITKITRSEQLTLFLCRRIYDYLTKPHQSSSSSSSDIQSLSDEDKDIVNYIGGSVVSKLKKAAWQHASEKEERLVILRTLQATSGDKGTDHSSSESKEDVHSKMTHTLDRGGLVYLKPEITQMFWLLEYLFCQASKGTTFSKNDYLKVCCSNNEVLCAYFETVYEAEGTDELKEELLGSLVSLYFKIRIYQKCRVFMDQIRAQKQMAKKQKGLRKTLAMKVGK